MRKFFPTVFNLISIVFVSMALVESYEPLLLNMEKDRLDYFQLPTTKIPSQSDGNTLTLCPPSNTDHMETLKAVSEKFLPTKYCLFKLRERECSKNVKPLLNVKYDFLTNKPALCGTSPKHQLHQFGFYFCGSIDTLSQLSDKKNQKTPEKFIKSRFFPIYELCIDVKNSTILWTKHAIMPLEKNSIENITDGSGNEYEIKSQYENVPDAEISTDALIFTEEHFKKLKEKYANQNTKEQNKFLAMISKTKKSETFYKMEETFIVPKEHVASSLWKKTVNHYINVGASLEEMSELMTAVNKKIKNVALHYHSKNERVTVYTKIVPLTGKAQKKMEGSMDFDQNAWIKLLYEEKTKSAVWIVVQNTPEDETQLIPCEKPINGVYLNNYPKGNGEGDGNEEDEKIAKLKLDMKKKVYSCYPNSKEIEDMFNTYLTVLDPLYLNE